MNEILVCYCCSQIFELDHISEALVNYLYIIIFNVTSEVKLCKYCLPIDDIHHFGT